MDLTNAAERLSLEFEGTFSPETVAEVLHDSALQWLDAPGQTHVPNSRNGSPARDSGLWPRPEARS